MKESFQAVAEHSCKYGLRSSLSALVAQHMGLVNVVHKEGGFQKRKKVQNENNQNHAPMPEQSVTL
jgi:hypothetical protein